MYAIRSYYGLLARDEVDLGETSQFAIEAIVQAVLHPVDSPLTDAT